MKSIVVANSKGGCGVSFLSFLLADHYDLHCVSNSDPKLDFRSLDIFSGSASRVPKKMLRAYDIVYDLRAPQDKLALLVKDLSAVVSHLIIPTATDAVSLYHTVELARFAQTLNLPVSIVINYYRTEKNLSMAFADLRAQLPHTKICSLRYTTLFGRLSYDGREWLEKVHHTKGEGRLLNSLQQIHEMFDLIVGVTGGCKNGK